MTRLVVHEMLSRLRPDDWKQIAGACLYRLPPFRQVISMPCGGETLAHALLPHIDIESSNTLLVDDCYIGPERFNSLGIDPRLRGVTHHGLVAVACVNTPLWVRCFAKIMV